MSTVYFSKDIDQAVGLFDAAGFDKLITPGEAVALKIHFGEPGNTAYLKPSQVKAICERVKALGGKPFYTDCNTLYKGPRSNTREHLKVALEHGFDLKTAGADAVIAEENDFVTTEVKLKHFRKLFLGGIVSRFQSLIVLTHFKGHEVTGFGGALKNIGMGFGSRLGKLRMHQDCVNCPEIQTCMKNQTIEACWFGSPTLVQEKMVEYAYGAVRGKRVGYISFIINVSPNCDCYPYSEPPIVPDIGVLASSDPVAIDQACVDLVNQTEGRIPSQDKFRTLWPDANWEVQLRYAEQIGLGSRKYQLVLK